MSKNTVWITQQRDEAKWLVDRVVTTRAALEKAKLAAQEAETAWSAWLWDITVRAASDNES